MHDGGDERRRDEQFSVKSYYHKLLVRDGVDFQYISSWIPRVPKKSLFLCVVGN